MCLQHRFNCTRYVNCSQLGGAYKVLNANDVDRRWERLLWQSRYMCAFPSKLDCVSNHFLAVDASDGMTDNNEWHSDLIWSYVVPLNFPLLYLYFTNARFHGNWRSLKLPQIYYFIQFIHNTTPIERKQLKRRTRGERVRIAIELARIKIEIQSMWHEMLCLSLPELFVFNGYVADL